jgi:hypothetical protein
MERLQRQEGDDDDDDDVVVVATIIGIAKNEEVKGNPMRKRIGSRIISKAKIHKEIAIS